ncbi:hypothetical protein M0R45_025939 [Rubus argutus]|uniref:Uncharacterized protein n=1 Tax=Rubus argutus TaxID=59490 RepID=A0AAW1WXH4_RUBAR
MIESAMVMRLVAVRISGAAARDEAGPVLAGIDGELQEAEQRRRRLGDHGLDAPDCSREGGLAAWARAGQRRARWLRCLMDAVIVFGFDVRWVIVTGRVVRQR